MYKSISHFCILTGKWHKLKNLCYSTHNILHALICMSKRHMTLSMCFFAIYVLPLTKYLFKSFTYLKQLGFFVSFDCITNTSFLKNKIARGCVCARESEHTPLSGTWSCHNPFSSTSPGFQAHRLSSFSSHRDWNWKGAGHVGSLCIALKLWALGSLHSYVCSKNFSVCGSYFPKWIFQRAEVLHFYDFFCGLRFSLSYLKYLCLTQGHKYLYVFSYSFMFGSMRYLTVPSFSSLKQPQGTIHVPLKFTCFKCTIQLNFLGLFTKLCNHLLNSALAYSHYFQKNP